MTGFEAFTLYYTLKLHFTTDYDYFKYNGKSSVSIDAFEKRKEKYHFYKLSRKIQDSEYKEFVFWVRDSLVRSKLALFSELMSDETNIILAVNPMGGPMDSPQDIVDAERRSAMEAKGADAWKPTEKRSRVVSAALKAYAALTTSADKGAVRDLSQL